MFAALLFIYTLFFLSPERLCASQHTHTKCIYFYFKKLDQFCLKSTCPTALPPHPLVRTHPRRCNPCGAESLPENNCSQSPQSHRIIAKFCKILALRSLWLPAEMSVSSLVWGRDTSPPAHGTSTVAVLLCEPGLQSALLDAGVIGHV